MSDLDSARIQLAEAMGWAQVERRNIKRGDKGYLTGKRPDAGNRQWGHRRIPNPFKDANDCESLMHYLRSRDWHIEIRWQPSYHPNRAPGAFVHIWHDHTEQHERTERDAEYWKEAVCELALKVLCATETQE